MCDGGAGMRDTEYIICAIVELNCNFFSRSSRVCRALDIGKAGGGIKGGGGGGWYKLHSIRKQGPLFSKSKAAKGVAFMSLFYTCFFLSGLDGLLPKLRTALLPMHMMISIGELAEMPSEEDFGGTLAR